MERPVTIEVENQQIVGMLHLPDKKGKFPLIIICHGFSGDKVGPWPYLFVFAARCFTKKGFAVFRFDFRGSGESEGKFEDQTISTELIDLDKVLEYFSTEKSIDPTKIFLLGHSRGGAVAIIKASQDSRVKALVTLAAPAKWDDVWGEEAEKVRREVSVSFSSLSETKNLVDEDFNKFNPLTKWGARVKVPWLIVHGEKDGQNLGEVPVEHAKMLFDLAKTKEKELKIIKKTGHLFFEKEAREEIFSLTESFLNKLLK